MSTRRSQVKDSLAIVSIVFAFFGGLNSALANGTICSPTINYSQTVSCSISVSSESDLFTFSANAGDVVTVLIAQTSGNLWPGISLRSPGGNELCKDSGSVSSEITACVLPSSGTYNIVVKDSFNGTFTGSYNLTLERLNPGSGPSISFGQSVLDNLLAGDLNSYVFSATGGDKVYVRVTTTSGNLWPGISLYTPAGVELCRNEGFLSGELDDCTIPGNGIYTLLVFDDFNGTFTGNYNLTLERLNPGSGPSISFGQSVSDNLLAGDLNSYVFSATGGDKAYVRMTKTSGNLRPSISLYTPVGVKVCWNEGISSAEINSCELPSSGTYTLLTYSIANYTGNYSLFLGLHPESISLPNAPVGAKEGTTKNSYSYSTGGSSSSFGHPVEYFFDWGDGSNSGWLPVGKAVDSHLWNTPGTYTVKVQARCSTNPSIVSAWSGPLEVEIYRPKPIEVWLNRYSMPTNSRLFTVAYGNNTFVAMGYQIEPNLEIRGEMLTSPEGIYWTQREGWVFTDYFFYDITYAENIFVAVGSDGAVITSPDGVNWAKSPSPAWGLNGVAHGNNIFVAVGTFSTIITSPDGKNWTKRESGVPIPPNKFVTFEKVAYGNGNFVLVGNITDLVRSEGIILTSTDGINWTRKDQSFLELKGITYGNGIFVAVGTDIIITSPDGMQWTEVNSVSPGHLWSVCYGNETYVAVGEDGQILASINGITWQSINPETTAFLIDVAYGNNTFVAVGDVILQSNPLPVSFKVDFDGDGATDVAAFHLPTDQFFTDYSGNMGQYGWGGNDCYPIVWDYDGNGTTDISVYHIPTNQWFVKGVPGDNLGAFGWGADEAVPVPGDYDGDGFIDRAFYHWPTNRWFIEEPGGVFTAYDFGWGGADSIPIAADYDGDGVTDMMLYHIPTNQWFVYGIGNLGQFGWNGSECLPVPGDWDGDGETEIGIYHWPTNQWFWRDQNGTAYFLGQYGWGGTQSFPIPGDYNGDGIMERAFYRPSENRWFIEGEADFYWGWDGGNFMPITSQTSIYNWFRFVLGMFQ